jgi:hypothetical protein
MATPPRRTAPLVHSLHFQLLLRSAAGDVPAAVAAAGIASVERFRPDSAAAPAVIAWLAKQGVVAHDAGFAVAASAPRTTFRRLFGAPATPSVPAALAAWVTAIEPSAPPEMFR